MNLKQMRYFAEIADAGSLSVAAARLHVAPTALSMQMARLEDEVGGLLFDRSHRPLELTPLGQYLRPRVKALLADARRLEDDARSVALGESGVLSIGYTRSTIFSLLPAAIRDFRKAHPKVKVELRSLLSEHQHAELQIGRIHIGVSRYLGPPPAIEGLTFTHLHDDPFVVAIPGTDALARRKVLNAQALSQLPFITYPKDPQSRFAEYTVSLLRSMGATSAVTHEAEDIHTALGMVASGLGFCLVGRSVSVGNRRDLAFVPVKESLEQAAVFAVTTTAGSGNQLITAFIDSIDRTIPSIQPSN